ncbi:MAG: hypothetical protein IPK63_23235 [Candidatus Competibacteraceae bacterium]|nr:hypothetical protein [Candidatus Competibacteraceae bacterium]
MHEPMEDQKTVRQRFILIVVTLGAGWIWIKYGSDALLSIGLIIAAVWASLRLGPGTGKRRSVNFPSPAFGPTEQEIANDPIFHMFPHNTWHNHKSD